MKSQDLKAEILGWLRYVRKQEIVCTEAGPWNADCWGLSDTRLIEVETKVTMSDLRSDFRKPKHRAYAAGAQAPNLFYFAVPVDMEIPAMAFLEEMGTRPEFVVSKYGLVVVTRTDGYLGRQTREVRGAQRLHQRRPDEAMLRTAMLRQSSEVCGLHQALRAYRHSIDSTLTNLANNIRMVYAEADKVKDHQTWEGKPYVETDNGTT